VNLMRYESGGLMYKHYPGSTGDPITSKEIQRGHMAMYTDYQCPQCGRTQSVPQMNGYGGRCIQCGMSSNPQIASQEAVARVGGWNDD